MKLYTTEQLDVQRKFVEATKPTTLYDIVAGYRAKLAEIDDAEGEVTTEDERYLDELGLNLNAKAEAMAGVYRSLMADAEACNMNAAPYLERRDMLRAQAGRIKQRLHEALVAACVDRAIGPTGGASLQLGPQALELADNVDVATVPDEYTRTKRTLDHEAIKDALKAGKRVEFAKIVRRKFLKWK